MGLGTFNGRVSLSSDIFAQRILSTMADREDNVYKAKLAEQAERYDEMVESMKKVASMDVELTVDERNLLSVAYKNVIGARRASWRIISSIEQKEENKGAEDKLELIRNYRNQVEKELKDICSDILSVLEKHLIPSATTGESKVFYYKMKGDYHRYLAEFATGNDRKEAAENSLMAYKAASDIAIPYLFFYGVQTLAHHYSWKLEKKLINSRDVSIFKYFLEFSICLVV